MKILNQIKKDAVTALKEGNKEKKIVLSTLSAEIQRNEPVIINGEKTWSDEIAIKTIAKLIEANKLTGCISENDIISAYMPEMMSAEELTFLIQNHIMTLNLSSQKDMGSVMNFLKQNHASKYDSKQASLIAKNLLTK